MELRRLKYFLQIAAEGSLGKASRTLGVAQPALGRQIHLLESELGAKLFQRTPKGMRLTEEGEYLRDALRHPLEAVSVALRNVRSYGVPVEATLVLGLPSVIAELFGPRLINRLRAELPNLSLRIAEGDSGKLASDLAQGLVDIALLVGVIPSDKIYHAEVISEELMLVGLPNAAALRQSSMPFSRLGDIPLILPSTQAVLRTKLAKAELAADIALNIALEIDSTELAQEAVLAGHGYTILPPLAFKTRADNGELAGIPIVEPQIDQIVRWAVRPLWRVPRSTYDRVEATIFSEWSQAVSEGQWPATWLFDLGQLTVNWTNPDPGYQAQSGKVMLNWHRF